MPNFANFANPYFSQNYVSFSKISRHFWGYFTKNIDIFLKK